jgi:putative FmdB family regulatory protein
MRWIPITEHNRRVPIYEYRCPACNKRSSALLASYSTPDPKCPHCGKRELKRLVSTFATVHGEDSGESENDFGGGEDSDSGGGDGGFDGDDY